MRSLLSVAPQRWLMLFSGFILWGLGLALFVRANLGLGPWDAFHQGLGFQLGITMGTASIIASMIVLLFWIPLKQRPGIGTICNALTIGPFMDFFLWLLPPEIESLWLRSAMLAAGMACVGVGSALYLPAGLGAGPRDGLMMGLHNKLGWSIRLSRTGDRSLGPRHRLFHGRHGRRRHAGVCVRHRAGGAGEPHPWPPLAAGLAPAAPAPAGNAAITRTHPFHPAAGIGRRGARARSSRAASLDALEDPMRAVFAIATGPDDFISRFAADMRPMSIDDMKTQIHRQLAERQDRRRR
jgi:uncharacterized membrane protein YczE